MEMRTRLQGLEGKRIGVTATFVRYGFRYVKGCPIRTILLKDIRDMRGNRLDSHLWINNPMAFDAAGEFTGGERVSLDGVVKAYYKGYAGQDIDLRFAHPGALDYTLAWPHNVKRAMNQVRYLIEN